MAIQFSTAVRNAMLDVTESVPGTSAVLRIYTGSPPANPAAAASGTLLVSMNLPSNWMADAASGSKALAGSWTGTASAAGTAGHYRIWDSTVTTCHEQGTVTAQVQLTTNALTAANGNVLNFASTTGVVVGMNVSGTGVPTGATVVAVGGTTVTLSATSTAGVSNGATITFGGDITLDNTSIASAQSVTINTKTLTAPNA